MSGPANAPAFPFVLPDEIGGYQMVEPGMTLRDYFAGQALIGLLANKQNIYLVAGVAYKTADAMLAARGDA